MERGSHLQLLAQDGLYARLWMLQQQERERASETDGVDLSLV